MKRSIAFALTLMCAVALLGATTSHWLNGRLIFHDDGTTQETILAVAPVTIYDDFVYNTAASTPWANTWKVTDDNTGTLTVSAAILGTGVITTNTTATDTNDVASELVWEASKSCGMEARVSQGDVDATALVVGFTDSQSESAGLLPVGLSAVTLTTTASDCAVFYQDAAATTDDIRCVSVKANVDGTAHTTSTTLTDADYHVYRVEINASGDVDYWLDGVHIATDTAAITTTADLCAYVGGANREAAVNTFLIDYIRVWEGR